MLLGEDSRRVKMTFTIAIILLAAVGAVIPWIPIFVDRTENLPLKSSDLPFVRLADVEQNANLVREEFFDEENRDRLNEYHYQLEPICTDSV